MPPPAQQLYEFGPFQLDAREGVLRQHGKPVPLTQKAFLTLLALLENGGRLVEKDELLQKVWPDTFVEESTLSQNIFTLRKKLGNDENGAPYIETVPKRGYRFAARVSTRPAPAASSSAASSSENSADPARIRSLAVLPLQDHSGEPGQDYFADGMTEALITDLAKIKALRVISRTSAMQYKGARKSLPQIAAELGVDAVVQGSVLRSGSRVRITAQLIHARGDQHLWSESYERDFRDILALQSEIARAIVDEIKIALTPQERVQLASARPVNPQAHEFYLKGRFYWNKRSEEPVRKALAFFQQAIECDPASGRAYAGLADSYNILGYYNGWLPREAFPKARAAAGKALELDESLAEGHAALGVVKRDFEWDWAGSEKEFRRAIELSPAYADAHHWCGTLLYATGRHEEGLRWKTKALELDPLSMVINADVGRLLYFGRQYEKASALYRKAIASDPNFWISYVWLGQTLAQMGRFEEAVSHLTRGVSLSGTSMYALARLGHAFAIAGQGQHARRVLGQLEELSGEKYFSPFDRAIIHTGLGETDLAFAWLDRALEDRSHWLIYLNAEPQLDPLRSDPRFAQLVRRVGLP